MRDIVKPAITLFIVCLVVSVCLALTYSVTKGKIEERASLDAENARKEVLAAANSFKKVDIAVANDKAIYVKEAYQGLNGNNPVGYVAAVMSKGYGGLMEITVGIDKEGKVSGVKLGTNNETPGLGSKANEKPFISQFADLQPKEVIKVVKGKKAKAEEIEAISGATITSKAVTDAVQTAIDMAAQLAKKEGTK